MIVMEITKINISINNCNRKDKKQLLYYMIIIEKEFYMYINFRYFIPYKIICETFPLRKQYYHV